MFLAQDNVFFFKFTGKFVSGLSNESNKYLKEMSVFTRETEFFFQEKLVNYS